MKFRFALQDRLLLAHIWAIQLFELTYTSHFDGTNIVLEISPPADPFNYFKFGQMVADCEKILDSLSAQLTSNYVR